MTKMEYKDFPKIKRLSQFYAMILQLSRKHGLFTLAKMHQRIFPRGQIVELPLGSDLYVPPDSHLFGFVAGIHENHITDLLAKHIRPGCVCVDVGANIGYFACMMSFLAGKNGEVHAYEPVVENFRILKINAEISLQHEGNLFAKNLAVSDSSGVLGIVRQQFCTHHQVITISEKSEVQEYVAAVTLDDEFKSEARAAKKIDILKIDVEGHEWPVMRVRLIYLRRSVFVL